MRRGVLGGLAALLMVVSANGAAGQGVRGMLARAAKADRATPAARALTYAPLLRPNQYLAGELGEGDKQLQNGWLFDQWTYQGAKNELAAFTVKASYEAALAIFLQQGEELKYLGEVKPATGEVTLELKLPAEGTYVVFVLGTQPSSRGSYTLTSRSQGSVTAVDYARLYPGGGDPNGRYALLVAADDYPGEDLDLGGGPTNDVMLMRSLLIQRYGFRPQDIVILRDVEANRDQIIEAFRRHLGQAGPNGVAVFHYSGHGMQLPDNRGYTGADDPEPDGKDEAVATWGTQGDLYGYLLDDELGILTGELRAGRVLIALDMCHAGTGTRGGGAVAWDKAFGGPEPEAVTHLRSAGTYAAPAVRAADYREIAAQVETPARDLTAGNRKGVGNEYNQPANHILLAAAQPTETSANYMLTLEDGKTARVGLFTVMLFQALIKSDSQLTFQQLMTQMAPEANRLSLEFKQSPQNPEVEGQRAGESIAAFLGSPR